MRIAKITENTHHHSFQSKELKIVFSVGFNLIATVAEIAGGIISGSLALISDALHNFSDTVSLLISLIAVKISEQKSTENRTYGYKRAEIIAALFNACVLVIVSFFLFKEAIIRFVVPATINTITMLWVAIVGLVSNVLSVLLLKKDAHTDMNIRSAYVHLLSDAFSSVAVIIGALSMSLFKAYWIDSILTIVIGLYVLKNGFDIISESIHILMQNVPRGINLKEIQQEIESIDGIQNIHHAHLWAVTEREIHFEAHVNVKSDILISESCLIKAKIEKTLEKKFKITHSTLQFEYNSCEGISLVKL